MNVLDEDGGLNWRVVVLAGGLAVLAVTLAAVVARSVASPDDPAAATSNGSSVPGTILAPHGGEPAIYAGRDVHTDQGTHTFDFLLHVGEHLPETMLHTAARQQMQPPVVFDRYEGMDRPPWGNSPPRALWLGAIERALADGKMSHLLDGEESDAVRPLFEKRNPDRTE